MIKELTDKAVKKRNNNIVKITAKQNKRKQDTFFYDTFKKASSILFSKYHEDKNWEKKIHLPNRDRSDALDVIMEYLETLPNNARKIEACKNIIKICRNISVKLQKLED